MRFSLVACPLFTCVLLAASEPAARDEQLLRSAGLGSDGPALLDYLKQRAQAKSDPERLARLIRQLTEGGKKADSATRELLLLGPMAAPTLRQALDDPKQAAARPRLKEILKWVEGPTGTDLSLAVLRLTASHRLEGGVPALLAFLPVAEDERVAEEVRNALSALALREGRPDPALLAALLKGPPTVRPVAAKALCRAEGGKHARILLRDPRPALRLALALALAEDSDGEAVPVLIALLAELSPQEAPQPLEQLQRIAGPLAPAVSLSAGQTKCRDAWEAWWKSADGNALLEYFRKRTPSVSNEQAGELVKQLGSRSFRVRQRAAEELVKLRSLALPLLEKAARSADLEVSRRARDCLREIQSAPDSLLSSARARMLALRKPAGAVERLLAYAPFADDEAVTEEIRNALVVLTRQDAKGRQALSAGLMDTTAARRSLAVQVLAEVGGRDIVPALRKRLDDPEPSVRFHTALQLALRGEKSAVATLVELLDKVSDEQGWQAEDLLRSLAGVKAPESAPGNRQKSREQWAAWWKAHGDRVDLSRARSGTALLGYTVVSQWDYRSNTNEIVELGRDGRVRWKIDNLGYSFDFDLLPGGRLLCAEHNQHRVTERNFKGDILWEYRTPSPINCQRLPSGHTFIASTQRILIVDRQGNKLLDVDRYNSIMAGQRMRDGQIVLVQSGGKVVRLDGSGKEVGSFMAFPMNNYGGLEALPGNRILLGLWSQGLVVEYDFAGMMHWEKAIQSPNFATRLPGGNTLIGSQDTKILVEVDRAGRVVWEYKPGMAIWRSRRR